MLSRVRQSKIKNLKSKISSFRPSFEALEDRSLLSVFTVVNTADSGPGSFRQAILDANGHANSGGRDEIHFNIPGTTLHTFTPQSSSPSYY